MSKQAPANESTLQSSLRIFNKAPRPGSDIWRFQSSVTRSSHTTKLELKRSILFET